jgi:hypothetical protein
VSRHMELRTMISKVREERRTISHKSFAFERVHSMFRDNHDPIPPIDMPPPHSLPTVVLLTV